MATYFGAPNNRSMEVIAGSQGDDAFYPLGGWDIVQGQGGFDTVFVHGLAANFRVATEEGVTYVDALSGASAGVERALLYEVERIEFSDQVVDLTLPRSFVGRDGNEIFVGSAGLDSVSFAGSRVQYRIEKVGDQHFVTDLLGPGGVDRLKYVEHVAFADMNVNLTVRSSASSIPQPALDRIIELYLGFFGRVPAADGLQYWIEQHASGVSLTQIADTFHDIGSSPALRGYTGYWDSQTDQPLSNEAYVAIVYRNVLGREALPGGIAFWADKLQSGSESRGSMVASMLDAAQTFQGDPTWGWVAQLLDDRLAFARLMAVDAGLNYAASTEQAIATGMAIVASVTTSPNPTATLAHIPVKTFDADAAVTLVGLDPASIQIAG